MGHPSVPDLLRGRWDVVAVVALGGACGGALRWLVGSILPVAPGGFPWATFVENVTGCLALGVLIVLLLEVWAPSRYLRPFLGVGLLGGYTTFSAYTVEAVGLARADAAPMALLYLFGSVAVGLAAVWIGMTVTRGVAVRASGDGRRRAT